MPGEGVSYPGSFAEGANILSPLFLLAPPPHDLEFLKSMTDIPEWLYLLMEEESHHGDKGSGWDFTMRLTLFKNLFSRTHHNPDKKYRLKREEIKTQYHRVLSTGQAGMQMFQTAIFPSNRALET